MLQEFLTRQRRFNQTFLYSTKDNLKEICGMNRRTYKTVHLYEACKLPGKHLDEGGKYGMAMLLYGCLTNVELYAKVTLIENWDRMAKPRAEAVQLFKDQIDTDPLFIRNFLTLLWKREPTMMRRVRKHLERAGIDCAPPLPKA